VSARTWKSGILQPAEKRFQRKQGSRPKLPFNDLPSYATNCVVKVLEEVRLIEQLVF